MTSPTLAAAILASVALTALTAVATTAVAAAATVAPAAASAAHRTARAAVPAANFLVEWRIQPTNPNAAQAGAGNGGFVIGTRDAATGRSGFGPGATVVGTARAPAPQGVRVANGKEASLRFDVVQTRTVYDLTWSERADAQDAAASGVSQAHARAQGAAGHDVTVHRVDGLRVTPHWTHGDSLVLDLELAHGEPEASAGDANTRVTRELALRSTVQLSFDEWQGVAHVGDGGDELQVRVSWR